jgi:hypothetical protein
MIDHTAIFATFSPDERKAIAVLVAHAYEEAANVLATSPSLLRRNYSHCFGTLRFHCLQAILEDACNSGKLSCACEVELLGSTEIIKLRYSTCLVLVKHVNENGGNLSWHESEYQRKARETNVALIQTNMPFYEELSVDESLPVVTLLHGNKKSERKFDYIELAIFASAWESHQKLTGTGNFIHMLSAPPVEAVETVVQPKVALRYTGEVA